MNLDIRRYGVNQQYTLLQSGQPIINCFIVIYTIVIYSMNYLPQALKNCFGSITLKSKLSTLQDRTKNKTNQHIGKHIKTTQSIYPLLPLSLTQQYEPIQIIGQGSFGIVVKARRIKDKKIFAIKTCKDGRTNQTLGMPPMILKQLAAFKKNQQNKYSIKLQQFIKSQESGTKTYHFVFQYAEYSLKSFLGTYRQLGINMKIQLIRQLVLGVGSMHSLNILHRDLKPDNILLCNQQNHYSIRIADMGTTAFKIEQKQGLIVEGVGSLWYKPPEALMGIESPFKSFDLWSLGIIMLQILMGRLPFRGCCGIDQLYCILQTMGSLKSNHCQDYYMENTPYLDLELPNFSNKSLQLKGQIEEELRTMRQGQPQIIRVIFQLVNVDPRKRTPIKQIIKKYDFFSVH